MVGLPGLWRAWGREGGVRSDSPPLSWVLGGWWCQSEVSGQDWEPACSWREMRKRDLGYLSGGVGKAWPPDGMCGRLGLPGSNPAQVLSSSVTLCKACYLGRLQFSHL